MNIRRASRITECKTQASLLLKSLRSSDPEKIKQAAKRFQRLPEFAALSVKRKHALSVIALEKGFTSWANLKTELNFIVIGFLNNWFAHYEEAKTYQKTDGGFLLPYKKQFFICRADYIQQLGFDPNDPDWQRIQYDWAKPYDQQAWSRLSNQWKKIQEKKHA